MAVKLSTQVPKVSVLWSVPPARSTKTPTLMITRSPRNTKMTSLMIDHLMGCNIDTLIGKLFKLVIELFKITNWDNIILSHFI